MRNFERQRVWLLSPEEYAKSVDLLVNEIGRLAWEPSIAVGVARGGRKLGQDLSSKLHIPYFEVVAHHNLSDKLYSETETNVIVDSVKPQDNLAEKTILLVDDICGTGATILSVSKVLITVWQCKKIYTATLCRNTGSSLLPDLYVWTVCDWVVFPWEELPDVPSFESLRCPLW